MPASKKPAIVLVPGSFCHSSHYAPGLKPLQDAGVSVHILDPPTYHSKKTGDLPTLHDDASFIAKTVEKLADQGEEVVLVAHSYGGTPASESIKGLSVSERKEQGKPGGVVRLAYISAVVPKVGEGMGETMVGGVQVPLEPDEVSVSMLKCETDIFEKSTRKKDRIERVFAPGLAERIGCERGIYSAEPYMTSIIGQRYGVDVKCILTILRMAG